MGIEVSNAESQPAIVYNKVFMESLTISQKTYLDDAQPPSYSLAVIYRMYGVDGDGIRHYKLKNRTVTIDDVIAEAMTQAAGGDMSLANAMGGIEIALAAILERELGTGATVS